MDRGTLDLLQDFYRLIRARRTPANRTRLQYMEKELRSRLGSVTDTSIDRMAQSVAAEVMKGDYSAWTPEKRVKLRSEIKTKVVQKLKRRG